MRLPAMPRITPIGWIFRCLERENASRQIQMDPRSGVSAERRPMETKTTILLPPPVRNEQGEGRFSYLLRRRGNKSL